MFVDNAEERFNCLYFSGSVDPKSGDYCTKRLFSDSKYFEYNLVLKYQCLSKKTENVHVRDELKERLGECLHPKKHKIQQQFCLKDLESEEIYVTPFMKSFEP